MAYHGVLIPSAIAAKNIDIFNRSVIVSGSDVDNGNVLQLGAKSVNYGEQEVFVATPNSGSSFLSGLWMAYTGEEIPITDSRYKGLDPDPRSFFNPSGKVFSAFRPQVGDIVTLTADAVTGGSAAFVNAAPGALKLAFGASQTAGALSFKVLRTTYISIGTGAIDSQRTVAYELECIAS